MPTAGNAQFAQTEVSSEVIDGDGNMHVLVGIDSNDKVR
jgi:hypothetical protein|tara:strand:- start:234 stop:350 length:117 start_codon:yes stop_codon:yes gene_type:complete